MGAAEQAAHAGLVTFGGVPVRPAMVLGASFWSFILPTERGLATPRRELLPDSVVVVVNGAIAWTKNNRADVWATDSIASVVDRFPPGLNVWGPLQSKAAFDRAAIPFVPLRPNAVMGPFGVPRPADAFFLSLAFAMEALGAKRVRVFGAKDWNRPDVRWRRWALARLMREAGAQGIEIERVR